MLWQRFGRGARGSGQTATAILLVEKKDIEEEQQLKAEKAARKREKAREGIGTKRKANDDLLIDNRPAKRPALQDRALNVNRLSVYNDGLEKTSQTAISVEDLKEERRLLYNKGAVVDKAGASKKGKGKGRELEAAMDDYINAQHLGFDCRRIVPILYFRNDKTRKCSRVHLTFPSLTKYNPATDYFTLCDTTKETGCDRCRPHVSAICCDFCHPEEFAKYHISVPEKSQKMASKSHIKAFDMTPEDTKLKHAIQTWRHEKANLKFRAATVRTLGIRIFMSDEVLNRIVGCAHYGKISTVDDLFKETDWTRERVSDYGEDILSLIHQHHPPVTETPSSESSRKHAQVRCRACKEFGHNSMYNINYFLRLLNIFSLSKVPIESVLSATVTKDMSCLTETA